MSTQSKTTEKNTTNISVFKSISQSGKRESEQSLDSIYEIIRNNPKSDEILAARASGKDNKTKSHKVYEFGQYVEANYYKFVKSTKVQSFTPNGNFEENNLTWIKNNPNSLSGKIYCDVDKFEQIMEEQGKTIEEAREYVWSIITNKGFGFIEAAYRSFGGEGFGFIASIEKLTYDNFATTWESLEKMFSRFGVILDPQTKNINRQNVISYDPNIFIRPLNERRTYQAIEPSRIVKHQVKKAKEINSEYFNKNKKAIERRFDDMYSDTKFWNNGRLTYQFFVSLAGFWKTINSDNDDIEEVIDSLVDFLEIQDNENKGNIFSYRDETAVREIISKICQSYDNNTETYVDSKSVEIETPKDVNVIPKGKYLSDVVNLSSFDKKYLVAPVGVGKSKAVLDTHTQGQIILAVPTQDMCDNNRKMYPMADIYNENEKTANADSKMIIVVYNSITGLIKKLNKPTNTVQDDDYVTEYTPVKTVTENFTLWLDEIHGAVTDASKEFAHKTYSEALDIISKTKFKAINIMTATPRKFSNPFLNSFELTVFKTEYLKPKVIKFIKTDDYKAVIAKAFEASKDGNSFVAILLNNKKGELDKIVALAENTGISMVKFNSDNKTDETYKEIISSQTIDKSLQAFVSTTVLNAGVSLNLNDSRNKKVTIFILGHFSTTQTAQFCDRIRDAKEVEIIRFKRKSFEDTKMSFDGEQMTKDLIEIGKETKEYMNAKPRFCSEDVRKPLIVEALKKGYVKFVGDSFKIDYEWIDNDVYEKEKSVENKDLEFFKSQIEKFDIVYGGIEEDSNELNVESKEFIGKEVEDRKREREIAHDSLIEEIQQQGFELNNKIINDKKLKLKSAERDIRYKIDYIYKNETDSTRVFDIYAQIGTSKQAWTKFYKQLRIEKARQGLFTLEDKAFIADIDAEFAVETVITNQTIKRLNEIISNHYSTEVEYQIVEKDKLVEKKVTRKQINLTKSEALKFLGTCFEIKRKSEKKDGKSVKINIIKNTSPCIVNLSKAISETTKKSNVKKRSLLISEL
jgi:hypothetical protein